MFTKGRTFLWVVWGVIFFRFWKKKKFLGPDKVLFINEKKICFTVRQLHNPFHPLQHSELIKKKSISYLSDDQRVACWRTSSFCDSCRGGKRRLSFRIIMFRFCLCRISFLLLASWLLLGLFFCCCFFEVAAYVLSWQYVYPITYLRRDGVRPGPHGRVFVGLGVGYWTGAKPPDGCRRPTYFDNECIFYDWINLIGPCMETITKSQLSNTQTYRIFLIKRPRRLFQT